MTDREQTISRLNEIAEYFRECRMNASFASEAENYFFEFQSAAYDAAEMLKEQEPVKPKEDLGLGAVFKTYSCGHCDTVFLLWRPKYCSNCGKAVKWE